MHYELALNTMSFFCFIFSELPRDRFKKWLDDFGEVQGVADQGMGP